MGLFEAQEAGWKRRLNVLEAKLSSLKVECVSMGWARRELDANVEKLGANLRIGLIAVLQQSVDDVPQMAQVFEVQLAVSLKRLESDFRFKGAKVSNEM